MKGFSSKTFLNLVIILFSVLTIYSLKNDVIEFFQNYSEKKYLVETTHTSTSADILNGKNTSCDYPDVTLKQDIERKEGILTNMYTELANLKIELDKPYAPYTYTYKDDLNYYNTQVNSYTVLKAETENLAGQYDIQVSMWNKCLQ